jgi:hypothetical protein
MTKRLTRLRFVVETSYGRVRAYPAATDQRATLLVTLAKTKTLLPQDINTFTALGYRCVDQNNKEIEAWQLY